LSRLPNGAKDLTFGPKCAKLQVILKYLKMLMSGKFESMTPAAKAPLDKEVYAQLKAEKDAADPNRAKLEAAAQERMALKANPELAAKKAAEAKRSAANLARVRAELQAIKDAKESERHEILQSIREIALGEPPVRSCLSS